MIRAVAAVLAILLAAVAPRASAADHIKIGLQKVPGPVFIALDKGYFAAEGLEAEPVFFEAGQPVAVATVSGDIDVGIAGFTGGLYGLAEQGALKIIGGQTREVPGFHANTVVASQKAYAAGLKGFRDLPGHSVAVTQIGSAFHYDLGLLAEKYHFDLKSVRILPLQTNPNAVAAVSGGSADAAVSIISYLAPAIERGDVKLLGYIGDETPWQLVGVFVATKTATERGPLVERFLRAFRRATRDYHDAFTGPDGKRRDGPTAPEMLAILAKHTGQPVERVGASLGYIDAEARIDVKDVARQVAWYKAEGLLKGDLPGESLIDLRYALPLGAK
jgi:NitT/TauT family transport system substrate-binding protein